MFPLMRDLTVRPIMPDPHDEFNRPAHLQGKGSLSPSSFAGYLGLSRNAQTSPDVATLESEVAAALQCLESGAYRDRTDDLRLAKAALSQLS
jgi:hypothetical protein